MITPLTLRFKNMVLLVALTGLSYTLPAQTTLDQYVQTGLEKNLVLQQKNVSLEKAVYALKTAKSLFAPTVALQAGYQHGSGGRSIDFPIGDLLNPVYSTLNQLTMSNAFPMVENVDVTFFPQNFYDMHVRASMPIVNADLFYNKKIQQQQMQLQEVEIETYKKELTKSIKTAYFNYLAALRAIGIYESALKIAGEGKRINESLVANGKGIKAYVIRSESEIQNIEAQKAVAVKQADNARMYFNFLLNADYTSPVDTSYDISGGMQQVNAALLRETDVSKREELELYKRAIGVQETVSLMNRNYWLPKLSGFVDVGSQASDFKVNEQSRYYFVGLQLDVPLFAGGRNRHKTLQTGLDVKSLRLQSDNTTQQLKLSANMAKNNLQATYENYRASVKQAEAAAVYYRLIEKGYKEGINTSIEMIDARNNLTQASLQTNIQQYQLLVALAAFERELSTYTNTNN